MSHFRGRRAIRWIGAALLAVALIAAARVDVPSRLLGLKGDEATYIAMALSIAYDGDLKFTRADLQRFERMYGSGPQGLFLKRSGRSSADALDFGKAFLYPAVAAPFVRVFGINGLLMLNVVLVAIVAWLAIEYGAARGGTGGLLFGVVFVFASISPIYAVWLTPEILNWSLVFAGYFLWLYKRLPAADAAGPGWLRSRWTDAAAACLLGMATFSKPPNALLILPLAFDALILRRRLMAAVVVSLAFLAGSAGLFGVNALISGELNYQGGERRTYYDRFPFSDPSATFDNTGVSMTTNESDAEDLLSPHVLWPLLRHNAVYFVAGRDAGLLPYYCPGVIAIVFWLASRVRRDLVAASIAAAVFASVVILLVLTPYSWNGGGGPPGNRYFLSLYPPLFFLAPALGPVPAILALGGLAFVGPWLASPFESSKYTWRAVETPVLRQLPIELTMVDDLPVRLGPHARIPFGTDPEVLLYFMDERDFTPEGHGLWVGGGRTTEIIVRSEQPLRRLRVVWSSPIANHVAVTINGRRSDADLQAGRSATAWLQVGPGVTFTRGSQAYVLRLHAARGFVPRRIDPSSKDERYLGAYAELTFE